MLRRVCHACASCCLAAFVAPALLVATTASGAPTKAPKTPGPTPQVSTATLPDLLQRGAQAFAAGDFALAAEMFERVESEFGSENEWQSGALPRRILPLRGFAGLRAGRAADAAGDLAEFLERFPDEPGQRSFALYALALALQQCGRTDEALARFAAFEVEHPGTAQAALARLQRAEILFSSAQPDEGFTLLQQLAEDTEAADSLRIQARLRALEKAVELRRDPLAAGLLFDQPWTVASMPEIAVLAFAAMETGDRMLAAGRAGDAVRAFQLVPPKRHLLAAQQARLDELQRLFAERAPSAASGSGVFWVDFYRARIDRIAAQLEALRTAEDYSWPLRLRLGQAMLLAQREHEAWLCFESVAMAPEASEELRREGHYRWILAAAGLARWEEALAIAHAFVERFPASDLAPEAFFLISRAHLERQDYPAAEPVLTDILTRFPAHPAALRSRFTRGWVRTMREDFAAAREDFEACVAAAPDGPLAVQARLWCGLTHHFAREHGQALETFDTLAQTHPHDPLLPEILYRRATTLYAMRDLPRARAGMEHFVTTYRMHARHAEALVLLGDILMGAGELDEARRRFAEVPPESVDSFVYATFQTGRILRAQGDTGGMIAHFSAYVRQAGGRPLPRVSEALYHIGWAEEQRGHPEAALPVYAETLARFGDDPSATEVGSTLAALHKLSRRLARTEVRAVPSDTTMERIVAGDFEGWLRAERENAGTRHLATWHARLTVALADLHATRKEPAQAELLLLGLAGSTPLEALDAPALAKVGTTLQSINSEDAVVYFRRLLAAYPRSPERAVAFLGLAAAASAERRFAEALAWAARFEDETPTHPLGPQVALLAADVLVRTGRHREAGERYDALLRLKSARGRAHAEALAGLARCARTDGDAARAIACFQRVYTLHRAQGDLAAEAYLESAPLFEQLGDLPAAAETYREMLALTDVGDSAQRERARAALETLERRLTPDAKNAVSTDT